MVYKKGYYNQTVFIRDEINGLLHSNYEEYRNNPVKVISIHTSKSIKLPVYLIDLKKYDTQVILRNNFYDWKVSINSKYPIIGIEDFIKPEREAINSLFCEGFEDKYIYGMYKDNNKQFTVELPSNNYILYTFFYIVRKCLTDNSNRI